LYGRIWNSLVAVHALPTETPVCSANCRKDFQGEFSDGRLMSSNFPSVKAQFLFNGFLPIKMPWVQTLFTNLEIICTDGHEVSGNLGQNFLLHDLYEFFFT
jgi:hypothetical protein